MLVRLLGDMPTFTGYEPNNVVGKGPGHMAQTQQLVPAGTAADDLSDLFVPK